MNTYEITFTDHEDVILAEATVQAESVADVLLSLANSPWPPGTEGMTIRQPDV